MFESYDLDTPINLHTITIETYEESGAYTYHRQPADVTKIISSTSNLLLNPIEPVTQPKQITHYLLLDITPPISLSPNIALTLFATFPIEIGIFSQIKKETDLGFFTEPRKTITLIDTFTFTNPKYTLYGTPDQGIICRFWKTKIHHKTPEINPLLEGIMKIDLENTGSWTELTKLVFDARHMKIYYSDIAYLNASVKITNKTAETSFKDILDQDMRKAVTLFSLTKIPVVEKEAFTMEWGL